MDSRHTLDKLADALDAWLRRGIGVFAWLGLVLIVAIITQIVLRYAFGEGRVWLEELQWHLYGVGILTGLGYTTLVDGHVRVDLVHERVSERIRAWVEVLGTVLLLWPFIYAVFAHSLPFFVESYALGEDSDAPAGLPYRWIIKGFIPFGFALLALTTLPRVLRGLNVLLHPYRP
ncbi:MAG: TRAP transporter small permease subunit [Candidatus Lambdaproteobacteria bacterium]|nr:TRAP transporter small permease subunit [Candidatus Lambdaproteobacteria bacterium]